MEATKSRAKARLRKIAMTECSTPKLDRLRGGRDLMRAGLIRWRIRCAVRRLNQIVRKQIGLDFLAADIGEHMAVDFHTGTEHLAAPFDHLLALHRIGDDVAIFERKV